MINLGQKGKDKISGFTGIVTSRHTYITGCDQYTLSPDKCEKGALGESYSFDEGRIEVIGKGITVNEVQTPIKGGPQHTSRSIR